MERRELYGRIQVEDNVKKSLQEAFFAYAGLTQVDRSPRKESEQRLPVPRPP